MAMELSTPKPSPFSVATLHLRLQTCRSCTPDTSFPDALHVRKYRTDPC